MTKAEQLAGLLEDVTHELLRDSTPGKHSTGAHIVESKLTHNVGGPNCTDISGFLSDRDRFRIQTSGGNVWATFTLPPPQEATP